jgi:hypothetical protein
MKMLALILAVLSSSISPAPAARSAVALQTDIPAPTAWPADLPVYDHILIIVEENKDYEQIIDSKNASYINDVLRKEGASLTQIYAEEHHSEGNYFWLFSGSNQNVGFTDKIPGIGLKARNLGAEMIRTQRTFKGYSEDLPAIGSRVRESGLYARKHVPWISFSNIPDGRTIADSSNLRFKEDFPSDYNSLPTVSFVIPNLVHDMHNGSIPSSIIAGDMWLKEHIDSYYKWAKQHNSLLILTFDESGQATVLGDRPIRQIRIQEKGITSLRFLLGLT